MTFTGVRCSKTYRYERGDPDIFESDLPIETRILTDVYLNDDEPSTGHRLVVFDIEVSMEMGIPNVATANNPITSIALYDQVTNEYYVLVLDKKSSKQNYTKDNTSVKFYVDEFDLLFDFLNIWEGINPTIVTGWNSDGFDIPYLYHRLQQVVGQNQAVRLSPIKKIKFSDFRQKYKIAGISSLDYLDLYKKFTYTQQPNYRLGTIGLIELGQGKIEYEGTLDDLYNTDLDKFIEYNLTDVKIVVDLEKKMKLIELVRGICHIGHVPYEDYSYSSRFLEGTIVTYLHRKGLVVTNKNPKAREMMGEDKDKFDGAYVKDPQAGKYDWVYSLDLQSLYPSIIMSLNISPETKVGKIVNFNIHDYVNNKLNKIAIEINDETHSITSDEFKEFIQSSNLSVSSNGVLYNNNKRGIIPEILNLWFDERVKYKDLMKKYAKEGNKEMEEFYDRRQHIQKIFLNSLYGVLGLPVFRFFDVDNAVAVTATGQDVIKTSSKFVNFKYEKLTGQKKDYCIYVDTDSLYFSALPIMSHVIAVGEDDMSATVRLAYEMETELNEFYNTMAKRLFNVDNHRFHIKGESVAQSAIWIAKKRYAMLKTYDLEKNMKIDSKLVVKGLDIVRSTFPILFKDYMTEIILDILNNKTKSYVDDSMIKFMERLKKTPYREIARNTAIKDVAKYMSDDLRLGEYPKAAPMHVKAVINYNQLLKHFKIENQYMPIENGEKIKYVLLADNPLKINALAFKDYEDPPQILSFLENYCDHVRVFESELKSKLEDFYDAMRWGNLPMDTNLKAHEFFSF